jgi:hypothetical protein
VQFERRTEASALARLLRPDSGEAGNDRGAKGLGRKHAESEGGNSAWTRVPLRNPAVRLGTVLILDRGLAAELSRLCAGVLLGGESLRESRMREIRTSGLTRGEAIVLCIVPPLLYRPHPTASGYRVHRQN